MFSSFVFLRRPVSYKVRKKEKNDGIYIYCVMLIIGEKKPYKSDISMKFGRFTQRKLSDYTNALVTHS